MSTISFIKINKYGMNGVTIYTIKKIILYTYGLGMNWVNSKKHCSHKTSKL